MKQKYNQTFIVLFNILSDLILFLLNKEGMNVASIVVTELEFMRDAFISILLFISPAL